MNRKYAMLLLLGVASTAAGIVIAIRHKTQIMNLLDKTKLSLVGRTINKIIVHCTAMRPSQSCSVEQIDSWHRQRGFDCIGYHYVVYRDGSVHEGRPLSKVGAHCVGQNSDSIGIAYCGGVAEDGVTPQDNRTEAQKASLKQLIAELRQAYGNVPVYGHRDFASKACPSFDAKKEDNYKNTFMATRKATKRKSSTTKRRTSTKKTTARKSTTKRTTKRATKKATTTASAGSLRKVIRRAAAMVRTAVRAKTHNETAARKAGRAVRGAARQTIKKNVGASALNGVRHSRRSR